MGRVTFKAFCLILPNRILLYRSLFRYCFLLSFLKLIFCLKLPKVVQRFYKRLPAFAHDLLQLLGYIFSPAGMCNKGSFSINVDVINSLVLIVIVEDLYRGAGCTGRAPAHPPSNELPCSPQLPTALLFTGNLFHFCF